MKIGIMQPYFFPYIGYFQLINAADVFMPYEHVSFRKKTWITRNRILDKRTGNPIYINVPVLGKSSEKLIKEISINNSEEWKKKLLNLIFFNYKKASFFNEVYPFLEKNIKMETDNLHEYNVFLISQISKLLEISTPIISNNSDVLLLEEQLTEEFKNQKNLIKSERIVRLCQKYDCDTYLNPIGGVELYDKEFFKQKNIELFFLKTNEHQYKQFNEKYISHLSIIDVLMHLGVNGTREMIKEYKLI